MTTKNEETLLGIEKCSELLLDKPIFFSLICHNSRKYRVADGEYIFFSVVDKPISGRITLYSELLRIFLKKSIYLHQKINNYGNNI